MCFGGSRLGVEVLPDRATYRLLHGGALDITHYGERFTVTADSAVIRSVPTAPEPPRIDHPPGRAPTRRYCALRQSTGGQALSRSLNLASNSCTAALDVCGVISLRKRVSCCLVYAES